MKRRKLSKKQKIWFALLSVCLTVSFVVMPIASALIYDGVFDTRYETASWLARSVDEFEGLQVEPCRFSSQSGHTLAGYQYSKAGDARHGVVVLVHGMGGGGQNTYMPLADYFTSNGFLVFAYDATANDQSEGDGVGGMPQGVMDLDDALRYVKSQERYSGLPIVLFGHSWGGYSVGSVLNFHPDVKAVVSVAGFDRSTELIIEQGSQMVGGLIYPMMAYVVLHERILFGEYAQATAGDGFANSEAGVMILHSEDDETVGIESGYDRYYERFGQDARFTFVRYTDRGHSYLYCSEESAEYRTRLNEAYARYVEEHGGEYNLEVKEEFMAANLDKSRCFELDRELMAQILAFYLEYCE